MKKTVLYMIGLLFVGLMLAVFPVSGEEALYGEVIRLHVLAESDSEEDQALKLAVRDAVLEEYGPRLSEAGSVNEAGERVERLIEEIRQTAQTVVNQHGKTYTVSVEYGKEHYPEREYENYRFPAGEYLSLRIRIGSGEGKNWWCVLFPPLCLDMATESPEDDALAVGLTPEEYRLIRGDSTGGYRIRFKILEMLDEAFTGRK